MGQQVLSIGCFVVLEAWRTRLPVIAAIALSVVFGVALFVQQLAITEGNRVETAFLAALTRLAAVFITSLYIISTMAREFNDRVADLTLALELPRHTYILGKLVGYATVAVGLAFAAGLVLSIVAPAIGVVAWTISLLLELWIVVALSLFCIITFNQVMPAASFVLAVYVLARSISGIRLIAASPLVADQGLAFRFLDGLVNAIAYVLPGLDEFTRTEWLVDRGASLVAVAPAAGQTAIYVTLIVAAALFDFQRRDF